MEEKKRKPLTPAQQRESITLAGFVLMSGGLAGTLGAWPALAIAGGIVFAFGIYGMSRR